MLNLSSGPFDQTSRRSRVLRRLFLSLRMVVLIVAAGFLTASGPASPDAKGPSLAGLLPVLAAAPTTGPATAPTTAPAALPADAIPPEVVEALRGLKATSPSAREEVYKVLNEKGDARIIPALNAFMAGQLQLRGDRLTFYGDAAKDVSADGRTAKAFPVYDAITGQPVAGPDGQPLYEELTTKNLATSFRKPLTVPQREPVLDLVAALSLLHPDPEKRLASIRDAGERALRLFPSADDEERVTDALKAYAADHKKRADEPAAVKPPATQPVAAAGDTPATQPADPEAALMTAVNAALADKPAGLFAPVPSKDAIDKVSSALAELSAADKALGTEPKTLPADVRKPVTSRVQLAQELTRYLDRLELLKKNTADLPKYAAAFDRQLAKDPAGPFVPALTEAKSLTDAVLGDPTARRQAVDRLGEFGTSRAANLLRKLYDAATRTGDQELAAAVKPNLEKADGYQAKVRFVQYTFAGLSTGSIYVLLALGLAIIFGLMGVINMAHGEFMMVGAFTTYAVASWFKSTYPGAYDYFPAVAVPAAFLAAAAVGLLTEFLVIRHLYGRTVETLLATIGVGLILVQTARVAFGDNISYGAPTWMQGSLEVAADLQLNRARLWTIAYCVLCIVVVYLIVNRTKLGLLLRATTQNRQMAAALGVPTRRVDAMTFAFGAGLAGMAGVVVPMIDKINPSMGQDYVVSSFMVVVVGGVGKLAGAIIAGLGIGAVGNYLEPLLGSMKAFAATSSVLSKVLVLAAVVLFLQWRPSGLFPPKGRLADA